MDERMVMVGVGGKGIQGWIEWRWQKEIPRMRRYRW
jgi:hypothetical protein